MESFRGLRTNSGAARFENNHRGLGLFLYLNFKHWIATHSDTPKAHQKTRAVMCLAYFLNAVIFWG